MVSRDTRDADVGGKPPNEASGLVAVHEGHLAVHEHEAHAWVCFEHGYCLLPVLSGENPQSDLKGFEHLLQHEYIHRVVVCDQHLVLRRRNRCALVQGGVLRLEDGCREACLAIHSALQP